MDREGKTHQDAGKLEGRYANYFKVGHKAFEFLIDFSQFYSESEEVELRTRIITTPVYAKALLETLLVAIRQYEQTFGAIMREDEVGVGHDT